ncbi:MULTISPECIES: MlaD family protein [unclassified Nocardia]|uniref:MlaD family protein n=1 Tax=unclassified Nocardia TaxID=2637762 RepID=UPI001CE43FC2|nr:MULTISPECIES: MlaD family protein [unclassified Nocardia]
MTKWRNWFGGDRPVTDEPTRLRRQVRLGIVGAVLVVIALAAAAVLYVVPFGKATYTAELSEAQSVRAGDDIRLAGITVGSVKSLELKPDRVIMKFTVDSGVFVGDESSLDVRMLTVVGGHYVALFPAGAKPLGGKVIPADRVRLPYSLVQTFQDATTPLNQIDGSTLRKNLATLDSSLAKAPESLRTTLDTLGGYVDAINRQRTQVSNAVAVADEYISLYDGAKTDLGRLMDNSNLLETVLLDKRAELRESIALLTSVLQRVAALAPSWDDKLKPLAQQLADALPRLEQLGQQLQPMIDSVHDLQAKVRQWLPDGGVVVDQSGRTVQAPAGVCVPLPGKAC